ncbi:mitochondrial-processing peptidase subunit alpha-like isoform X2 [Ostrea edulis]|uniref:mitochondrial-processing peptidase subunit alpha-like isoform X2 n=1 Tax=Ostrea edulis TaxID=37623 RepID=UPI0024AFB574|nr:mitochondrial-processing peptidase subunit alpha-like isoform X2 [Ostrea edulis]
MLNRYLKTLKYLGGGLKGRRLSLRRFSATQHRLKDEDTSLAHPLPNFPELKYAVATNEAYDAPVTVLENGLTVASQKMFGHCCTLGVLIKSGCRFEVAYPSGISHFIEKLGFCSTTKYQSSDEILQIIESYGGLCDCQSTRDVLMYALSVETEGFEKGVDVLSEVTLRPVITDKQIDFCKMAVEFDLEKIETNPQPDLLMTEMIHAAGYRDNTLGLPRLCPQDNINKIDKKDVYTYMSNFHDPSRMVLCGVGVEHDRLVELARDLFVKKTPIWKEDPSLVDPSKSVDHSVAQYTGGKVLIEKDLSNVSMGPNPFPELAHLVVGLESCSSNDDDFVAFCILSMMLGGGNAFSAGGPGKGMYTRLYTNVLNWHHWMFGCVAVNHVYDDSGLFCIMANAPPSKLDDLATVVLSELLRTPEQITKEELDRAKKQLQSMLMYNLETRSMVFEDTGRQVISQGVRKPAEFYLQEIDKVKKEDIERIAKRMLRSKPSLAAFGTLDRLPPYEKFQEILAKGVVTKNRRRFSSLFS